MQTNTVQTSRYDKLTYEKIKDLLFLALLHCTATISLALPLAQATILAEALSMHCALRSGRRR